MCFNRNDFNCYFLKYIRIYKLLLANLFQEKNNTMKLNVCNMSKAMKENS
jgi:hypothetical protein